MSRTVKLVQTKVFTGSAPQQVSIQANEWIVLNWEKNLVIDVIPTESESDYTLTIKYETVLKVD